MKILLVEDLKQKREQVDDVIRSTVSAEAIVDQAISFASAIRALERTAYDLLVLDLVLPVRDGEPPITDGGSQVLQEILAGVDCKRPSHIVGLSEHANAADALAAQVPSTLLHFVSFDETGDWRAILAAKLKYIEARLAAARIVSREHRVDVALVTSSPAVELTAVLGLPCTFVSEFSQEDAIDYYAAEWNASSGRKLSVIACAAPIMGMTASAITAYKVIERWRPRILCMSGIAAGLKREEQQYGDILVASSAFDYGSGKIRENESGKRQFLPAPNPLSLDPQLHALLQRWERQQLRMDEIRRAWPTPVKNVPNMIFGLMASGAAVVQSPEVVSEILSASRKVIGLEMEAYGIFHAVHLCTTPKPRVIVAKSISDFADPNKGDVHQQYAAFTSARFLYEFITQCGELH